MFIFNVHLIDSSAVVIHQQMKMKKVTTSEDKTQVPKCNDDDVAMADRSDAPTPQAVLRAADAATAAAALVAAAIHVLLFVRGVYPPRAFAARRCPLTGLVLPRCRVPAVETYICRAVHPLVSQVTQVSQIAILILRTTHRNAPLPIEQLVIDIQDLSGPLIADARALRESVLAAADRQNTQVDDSTLLDSLRIELDAVYLHEQMRGLFYKLTSLPPPQSNKTQNRTTPTSNTDKNNNNNDVDDNDNDKDDDNDDDMSFQIVVEMADSRRPSLPTDISATFAHIGHVSAAVGVAPHPPYDDPTTLARGEELHKSHALFSGVTRNVAAINDSNTAFGDFIEVATDEFAPAAQTQGRILTGGNVTPLRKVDLGLLQLRFVAETFQYTRA